MLSKVDKALVAVAISAVIAGLLAYNDALSVPLIIVAVLNPFLVWLAPNKSD